MLLRWALEREVVVIPKSANRERIVENSRVFDFELGAEELARLDGLDRTGGTERALEQPWWTLGGRARSIAGRLAEAVRGRH